MPTDTYQDPLAIRYPSSKMKSIFSDDFKFQTWRKCWTALAEAQMALGIDIIKPSMIDELVAAQKTIDYDVARAEEKRIRHDVMAHIHEYGTHCPTAKGITHLGATSMFVCDNTELIQQREAMKLVFGGLVNVINNMSDEERTKWATDVMNSVNESTKEYREALYHSDIEHCRKNNKPFYVGGSIWK